MTSFWNLKTKFVGVLILLLLGSLVAQSYVHERGKERLREEVIAMTADFANEVTRKVPKVLITTSGSTTSGRRTREQLQVAQVDMPAQLQLWFATPSRKGPPRTNLRMDAREYEKVIQRYLLDAAPEARSFDSQLALPPELVQLFNELHQDMNVLPQIPPAPGFRVVAMLRSSQGSGNRSSAEEVSSEAEVTWSEPGTGPVHARSRHAPGVLSSGLSAGTGVSTHDVTNLTIPAPAPSDDIEVSAYTERLQSVFEENRRQELIATIGIFLLGIGLAWFVGIQMTRPVYTLASGFQKVADGDLGTRVPEGRDGEFGLLGRQFNAMVGRLRQHRELQRELELRERVQHMGDLAAGVAHDVRNPLNAIHLNVGQIRDEFLPSEDARQQRFLRFTSDIQKEVERLNQLVTNFLSLAQPSTGATESVAANELVRDLDRLIRKEAAARRVELLVNLDPDLPLVNANEQELKSAFLNIAMNSLQALEPKNGGTLDVVTGRRARADGGTDVAISFVDSGIGISPENLERVFIPYFTTREGGTGLGMAIARRIAERFGGRLEVRSQQGVGTTVSFVFPAAGTAPSGQASETPVEVA